MMRKFMITCVAVIVFASVFLGRTMLTSMAKEEKAATRYYKSVEIQEGDSLWSLAKEYREGGSLSAKEYVEELKKMNNLREDTIHTGQYLTRCLFCGRVAVRPTSAPFNHKKAYRKK